MTEANGADGTHVPIRGDVATGRAAAAMAQLKRLLDHQVSIAALLELALVLAIPYLSIGLVWAYLHTSQVHQIEDRLAKVLPANADVAAYLLTSALWPASLPIANACPAT